MVLSRYTAVFERVSDGWLVALAEDVDVRSYGRTLASGRDAIRDATALRFDCNPAELELFEDVRLPEELKLAVAAARTQRDQARVAQDEAQASNRKAARMLVQDIHLSLRDAADLLGVSPARVQQFLHDRG